MIYTVLILMLVSFLGTNATKPILKMPPQATEKFEAAATQCIKETGAPEECLKLTLPWKLPHNELSEKYLHCLVQKTKLASTDGHLLPEKVLRLFVNSDLKEDIENVLTECNSLEGENAPDVTFRITNCVHEKAPVILSL